MLALIPTQDGLPDENYKGCKVEGAICLYGTIKSITKESDGSTVLTVPVKISDSETKDTSFYLNEHRSSWEVGNKIFMNFSPNTNKTYLFIGHRSNMLLAVLSSILNSSQGVTAIVELDTGREIK